MTISTSIRKASSLAALVGSLFAASTLTPRALEAQQSKKPVAEAMHVYVMGTNTTHAGLAGVPYIKRGAQGYTGAAQLVNSSRTSILSMQAAQGDSVAFVAEKPAPHQQVIVGKKTYKPHDVVIDGEHKLAVVVPAAEVYKNKNDLRIQNGRAGVDLALNMSYSGAAQKPAATHIAQAQPDVQIPVRKSAQSEILIPVNKQRTPLPPDTVYKTIVDTVRVPVHDTIQIATPPPPPVVIREQAPKPVTHNQLDLGLGYDRTTVSTPDMNSTFKSLGIVGSFTASDPKTFFNVEGGVFGKPIFKASYEEIARDTTRSGSAQKAYINGILMRRLGNTPLALGIANELEYMKLDNTFNNRQELRNYTSGRVGILLNSQRAYGQASVGAGLMIQDGSDIHTVSGPAWDLGARVALLPSTNTEIGLHGNFRKYSNLTGSACCEEVNMQGQQWSAGAHLKMFPLVGGDANSSLTLRPIVGIDFLHDNYTGTHTDPRNTTVLWGGIGINFGRHASEPVRTSVTPSGYSAVAQKDTARAGPVVQPVGVTSSYRRQ